MKTAIITGAAGGIGRALLAEFAQRGCRIVAVDLPGKGLTQALAPYGADHIAHPGDLADDAEVLALFARLDRLGLRPDILINNAAMGPTMTPTRDTDPADFRHMLRVNLLSPFTVAREAARRMAPGGVIVNTTSLAGVIGNPRRNAYAAAKAALNSFTKSMALEWAARGIRVCALAPGYVRTEMMAELERAGKADLHAIRQRVPMGRMGRPDEMAAAIGFLASDKARYITGAVLGVDGGWTSFNQAGIAHDQVEGVPEAELSRPDSPPRARVVVVTGAARGIGAATARTFAAAGERVILLDQDGAGAAALAAELGPQHHGQFLDVADDAAVAATFATLGARFGGIDVLVNNAAIADVFKPGLEQTADELMPILDVNLTGAFACARAALLQMKGPGVIVNIGSINTFLPFVPRHTYGASKAAIDVLTRCLAAELGPEGHRVVTVAPGYIRTPSVAELERDSRIDSLAIRRRIPMGDFGRPQDIADAVQFMASDRASYINGTILYVDGGWTSFGNAGHASDPQAMDQEHSA